MLGVSNETGQRYRVLYSNGQSGIRYGAQQAEAATCGSETTDVFFVSDCDIYYIHLSPFDESLLSAVERKTPLSSVSATVAGHFSYPIQSICSGFSSALSKFIVCGIDNRGNIKVFEETTPGTLNLLRSISHSDSTAHPLEESWAQIRLSPSGGRFFTLHGLSSSVNVFSLTDESREVLFTSGYSRAACWRDESTLVIGENKQLSQYYVAESRSGVAFNNISIGTSNISCVCSFSNGDICSCTENDRGVFVLNSRNLKIVKRWKAPIRDTIIGAVTETVDSEVLHGKVNVAYLCGDDNELLLYNASGKEEDDVALRERHSINIRSRSRIIGMCIQKGVLYVLGQNGDLDVIVDACNYICERRKRMLHKEDNESDKKMSLDD